MLANLLPPYFEVTRHVGIGFEARKSSPGFESGETQVGVRSPRPWSGAVLLVQMTRSPRDHARFFQNRTGDIEIDPKSIYVHISGPHPDRSPPELVKNHQKSRKFQRFRYFSNLSRHGFSRNVTEQSTMRKISIFSGNLNWPSNYADLELNPLRLVKSNV